MGKPGLAEILIVLLIVLLLFGAKRLPDMARSLGRSMRIFKSEVKEMRQDDAAHPEDADDARRESASPRGIEGRIVEPGTESPRVTAAEPSDRDR